MYGALKKTSVLQRAIVTRPVNTTRRVTNINTYVSYGGACYGQTSPSSGKKVKEKNKKNKRKRIAAATSVEVRRQARV